MGTCRFSLIQTDGGRRDFNALLLSVHLDAYYSLEIQDIQPLLSFWWLSGCWGAGVFVCFCVLVHHRCMCTIGMTTCRNLQATEFLSSLFFAVKTLFVKSSLRAPPIEVAASRRKETQVGTPTQLLHERTTKFLLSLCLEPVRSY